MANPIGINDDVTNAADKLMKGLLTKASDEAADVDFQLSVMQTVTRYLAVKNRMNVPDEGNAFDDWRSGIGAAGGAAAASQLPNGPAALNSFNEAASAASLERAARVKPGAKTNRRRLVEGRIGINGADAD